MELNLSGRTALVTGASSGIGREIAHFLAAEGVQVAVLARRRNLLDELAAEINAGGGPNAVVLAADLTETETPALVRAQILERLGSLDILVNCAGGSRPLPTDAPDEAWEEAITLNFTALRRLTHAFLPIMQQQQWGRIINITGSLEPMGLNAANAAKAAVHMWAKALSREVGRYSITINSVSPGRIMSEQVAQRLYPTAEERQQFAEKHIPMGYFGEPRELAGLVTYLASPMARYITGEIIHVDGGRRLYAY